jgi:hypothetical protein
MVLVEIQVEEIKAIDELLKDAKMPYQMGFILGAFRMKIQQAIDRELNKERRNQAKKILGVEDEKKEKS